MSAGLQTYLQLLTSSDVDALNKALVQNPSVVNERIPELNITLLHYACQAPQATPTGAQLLLYHKANINAKDSQGRTPFHYAAGRGHWETCRLLLNAKDFDHNSCCDHNRSNFFYMADFPFAKICDSDASLYRDLIRQTITRADAVRPDFIGSTPLHRAAAQGNLVAIVRILELNVDVDPQNKKKETPLYLAVDGKHIQTAELLLSHHADPTMASVDEQTPLELADHKALHDLADIMRVAHGKASVEKEKKERKKKKRIGSVSAKLLNTGRASASMGSLPIREVTSPLALGSSEHTTAELFTKLRSAQVPATLPKGKRVQDVPGIHAVREFLKNALQRASVQSGTDKIHWPALFQAHMRDTRTILSQEEVNNLNQQICNFLEIEDHPTMIYAMLASSLKEYIGCHIHDPENSIIGLPCKESIIEMFSTDATTLVQAHCSFGDSLWQEGETLAPMESSALKFSIGMSVNMTAERTKSTLDDIHFTLIDRIARAKLFLEFSQVLARLSALWKGTPTLPGDIFIVASSKRDQTDPYSDVLPPVTSSNTVEFRFMRYAGGYDETTRCVSVYCDPDESETIQIPIFLCMPFPPSWTINFGSKKSIDRLVENPSSNLFSRLVLYLKNELEKLLEKECIDTALLERVIVFQVEVSESNLIKDLLKHLEALANNIPPEFVERITTVSARCIKRLEERDMPSFYPTQQDHLDELRSISMEHLLRLRLDRFITYCKQTLAFLENQKMLVVNGTKKQEITEWWLTVIESRVEKFLKALNWDFTAVRYDYIEKPPDDLNAVRSNLKLVNEILEKSEDIHGVQALLQEIKDVVYPKIDMFIQNAQLALCEKLHLDPDDFSVAKGLETLAGDSLEVNEVVRGWVESLLKDIEYLETIKKLEIDQPSGKGDLNVVPISGLVMSRFYRLQNELKTVLEVWDPTWAVSKGSKTSHRRSMENRATMIMASPSENLRSKRPSRGITPTLEPPPPKAASFSTASPQRRASRATFSDLGHHRQHKPETSPLARSALPPSDEKGEQQIDLDEKETNASVNLTEKEESAEEESEDGESVLISVDDILSNLAQMESLSQQASRTRLYTYSRDTAPSPTTPKRSRVSGKGLRNLIRLPSSSKKISIEHPHSCLPKERDE